MSSLSHRNAIFPVLTLLALCATSGALTGAETSGAGPSVRRGKFAITEADRSWWSFQPLRRPPTPGVRHGDQVSNPIDAFLLARLEPKGLSLSPPASRRELIRRVYFDLIGLPPAHEEVTAFVNASAPNAWEEVIDHLLSLPQYGERWGRHWLDLVRYAESNGYERDGAKPHAWRYRDYVIRSFNQDKPYDRFLLEQLAGDQLPGEFNPDAIIATGFYRLHVWDDEPDSTLAAEFDDLDDIVVTTSATFLGLTIGCARCHDHKFDPISQADYYQTLAFLRSINPYGQHHKGGGGRGTGNITRPLAPPAEVAAWTTNHSASLRALHARLSGAPNETRKQLEAEIQKAENEPPPYGMALAVNEDPRKPTHILYRGDVQSPGAEVHPGFPGILDGEPRGERRAVSSSPTSGVAAGAAAAAASEDRLSLARWMARPEHPLTARVLVNRLWQHHFGRALARTPNDFGRTGESPTHPELLDFLAAEFVRGGWKLKRMHKLILMSRAYQMASRATNPAALATDEANELFWRQNPRRAEAEVLRDTLLAVSGSLNLKMGGPSVFPTLPKEVHSTQDAAGKGWSDSPPDEQDRRTIYLFVKRALLPPLLETFDYTTTTVPVGARAVTTVAPQALMLLNDDFVQVQAARFAARLRREAGEDETAQIRHAFAFALQRPATAAEISSARAMLARQRQLLPTVPERAPDSANHALEGLCAALLNLNELLYLD